MRVSEGGGKASKTKRAQRTTAHPATTQLPLNGHINSSIAADIMKAPTREYSPKCLL